VPQYAAQSTAVVCNDAAKEIGDLYRLFLVLWYSNKPIVTGAFSPHSAPAMIDLLVGTAAAPPLSGRSPARFLMCVLRRRCICRNSLPESD